MSAGPIGHGAQEDAVRALSRHYTEGRLDVDSFDERVHRARSATTAEDLAGLFADLPDPHPDLSRGTTGATGPGADDSAGATARFRVPDPGDGGADPSGHPAAGPYPDAAPTSAQQYPQAPGTPGGVPWYLAQDSGGPGPYGYGSAPAPGYGPAYPPHPGPPAYGYGYAGYDPYAPFGREPFSGRPYSDKQKIVAGLLQLFLPFGIGRFYSGHTGLAIAQLLVMFFTFGLGAIWSFIDGIVLLAGSPVDGDGRPLRP